MNIQQQDAERWLIALRNIVAFADNINNLSNTELLEELQIANLYRTSTLDNFEMIVLFETLQDRRRKKQA